jgi:TPP-dependent pyruvate/acetoin dehydrogenase alpha subunit
MPNIPLPPETPEFRKRARKKIMKPEDMEMSDAMQQYLRDKTDAERSSQAESEMADDAKEEYKTRGYAKGGMVRGCGVALKGHGKGKVY